MTLELLPNEIFLDIFTYFNGVELLCTFYGLNWRLNTLLHERFLNCSFKFNSVSKRNFDMICQQYLPVMANCITTLQLADGEETPTQIKLFLPYMSLNQFSPLQMLSLLNLRSYATLIRIIEECHHLSNLTHLEFMHCYFQDNQAEFQLIVNHIWELPKLTHCKIGITIKGKCMFCTPTRTSLSLKSISTEKNQIELEQINRLFECTPALNCLSISVQSFIGNNYLPSPLPTLTDLSISSFFTCNASNMAILLQNTPNLHRLDINLSSEIVDGNQWEEIIRNCLPNLEIFQLKMKLIVPIGQNIQQQANHLLTSFQTPFWIDEHQWYIRCITVNRTIFLYSLSSYYEENLPVLCKSTYAEDDQQDFYNRVTKIISPAFFDQPIPPYIRISKINHLSINLPINERFWSIVPNLNRLKSLEILLHTNAFQSQVQALLNRAPCLNRLTIKQHEATPLQTSLFKYKNASVYELDLRYMNHYFNKEECIKLSNSPLGIQCEKLYISVQNRENIISLVKSMGKLRLLNVRCKDEDYTQTSMSMDENDNEYCDDNRGDGDNYIKWLKSNLPSSCVISRDLNMTCNIIIWL